jgi:cellulose biosynthesis protein BcsQ
MTSEPLTVAILSGKGGVGKTTIALNLAKQLSRRGPVWLIDIDLFNRGATSALWASEKGIPISVAELIIDLEDNPQPSPNLDALTSHVEERLREKWDRLPYDEHFTLLPAARAREGRRASYFLWRGMRDVGVYAETFLSALVAACGRITPRCVIILDGHGGLDELSVAGALVSDLCYIVNEADLVTFTGSVMLHREISEQAQASENDAWVEFIINRVPPRQRVETIESDFGPMLDAMSPAREPIAMFFPLEPELFGVFGDDPFVSELYTRYWFSRKIAMLADRVAEFGIAAQKLPQAVWKRPDDAPKIDLATRTAVRREFHQRGVALLIAWMSLLTGALLLVNWKLLELSFTLSAGPPAVIWFVASAFAVFLLLETIRWIRVQREHLGNLSRLRGKPKRRLRLGDSEAAAREEAFENALKRKWATRPLRLVILVAILIAAVVAYVTPKANVGLERSSQRRTAADMRTVGTVLEARESDTDFYVFDDGTHEISQLSRALAPTYTNRLPTVDAWGNPFRYYSYFAPPYQSYALVSAGEDGRFEHDRILDYPVFQRDEYGRVGPAKQRRATTDVNADVVFSDGLFLQAPAELLTQ